MKVFNVIRYIRNSITNVVYLSNVCFTDLFHAANFSCYGASIKIHAGHILLKEDMQESRIFVSYGLAYLAILGKV